MSWKYTDSACEVAMRVLPNGSIESCLVSALPEGAVILPADPPPVVVPSVVTMRQAQRALLQAGLLTQVEAAVAALPGIEGDAARIDWLKATTVDRNSQLVQMLATGLGLTAAQLDELFTLAASF